MFNLVAINLKDEHGNLAHKCGVAKCTNLARYQLYPYLAEGELPDWEGSPICSRHLVEEARLRPEITMSLIDILIDEMESKHVLKAPSAPSGVHRVIPMPPR
jgi:hypothetical protein